MKNTGSEFESYVQYVYHTLLNLRDEGVRVSRRMDVKDTRGNLYNIDVYYEFVQAGVTHRVAIECKDTQRAVERDDVIAFHGKLQALPSTVGVFASTSEFQPAARKYLEDNGILYVTGDELPRINHLLADRILSIALPDESAVGEPFWTFMEVGTSGENTGSYYAEPSPLGPEHPQVVMLFFSRKHAEFWRESRNVGPKFAVRGLPQHVFRTTLLFGYAMGAQFACLYNLPLENQQWPVRLYSAQELAEEYFRGDLADQWRKFSGNTR